LHVQLDCARDKRGSLGMLDSGRMNSICPLFTRFLRPMPALRTCGRKGICEKKRSFEFPISQAPFGIKDGESMGVKPPQSPTAMAASTRRLGPGDEAAKCMFMAGREHKSLCDYKRAVGASARHPDLWRDGTAGAFFPRLVRANCDLGVEILPRERQTPEALGALQKPRSRNGCRSSRSLGSRRNEEALSAFRGLGFANAGQNRTPLRPTRRSMTCRTPPPRHFASCAA
jgi:hypothetical protein